MSKHLISVFTKPWTEPLQPMAYKVAALGLDGVELPVRPGYQVTPENAAAGLRDATRVLGANKCIGQSTSHESLSDSRGALKAPLVIRLTKIPFLFG